MGVRRPTLTVEQVLAWADAHHLRTGSWPTTASGRVRGARGERWRALDRALRMGHRGLPGGDSLARLLDRERRPSAGDWRAWTDEEDSLVRDLPPVEAARRTGRTVGAIYQRRWVLGLTLRHGRRREGGRGSPPAYRGPGRVTAPPVLPHYALKGACRSCR